MRALRMQSSFLSVFSNSLKHDGTSAFLAPNITLNQKNKIDASNRAFAVCGSRQSKEPDHLQL
jgi:hypothetical protein